MARTTKERHDVVPDLTDVFREYGFEGASLKRIEAYTGLGKGSLYHFFPGGKEEMAQAALDHVAAWFEDEIFTPLENDIYAARAIDRMFAGVTGYFRSGRRVCLMGAFALDRSRDMFSDAIAGYFTRWIQTLARALGRAGLSGLEAQALATQVIADIQGAIVLSRALNDPSIFEATIARLEQTCRTAADA